MNLQELARLAAEAIDARNLRPSPLVCASLEGPRETLAMLTSCTPERIAALVRVAEAAKAQATVPPVFFLQELLAALRDLEATP